MLVVHAQTQQLRILNLESEKFEPIKFNVTCSVAKWHPRLAQRVLVGSPEGKLMLYDLDRQKVELEYRGTNSAAQWTNGVVDLAWSPGEDVFLALFKEGNLYLYSQQEPIPKMEFETNA